MRQKAWRMLSAATRAVWAKSQTDEETHTQLVGWLPLHQHLDDSLGIAGRIWGDWLPDSARSALKASFGSAAAARAVFMFLAGTHDVGKASPAFSVQVAELANDMASAGLKAPSWLAGAPDRAMARHEVVSHLALQCWLEHWLGESGGIAQQLASVVGSHHGSAPTTTQVMQARDRPDLVGEGPWADARSELIEHAAHASGLADHHAAIAAAEPPQTVLVLLSGMVILADWLASNEKYFPQFPLGESPEVDQDARVAFAWDRAGFPARWRAQAPADLVQQFAARFGFDSPTATQRRIVELAQGPGTARLLILEAAMGSGKTEAALAAAEVLAERTGAGGIFIALPTQATTDSMLARVLAWADTLDTDSTVFLAHGKAALNPVFEKLERDAYFSDIGRERAGGGQGVEEAAASQGALAHHWFSDRRRGPLANLVVGTIDQALVLALNSKHLMLRHLALANKVVIIDEAHAFSTYMSRYLDMALEWLGGYGTPVIILSATLPAARRADMVGAYERGARHARGERSTRATRAIEAERLAPLREPLGYPSIVASDTVNAVLIDTPEEASETRSLALERLEDTSEALVELLREQLGDGGCAAVIHNTVARVQHTAGALRSAFPDVPVIVAHSRFLASDRVAKDTLLLDLLGSPRRSTGRPNTCIIVATQVVEQSLDIDFDIMISDVAPVDLLLQRSGRLHRHRRGPNESERPAPLRSPKLFITGVDDNETPPALDGGAAGIYGDHLLLRTLAVLEGRTAVSIPDDISPLVQLVYGDADVTPEGWTDALHNANIAHEALIAGRSRAAEAFRLKPIQRSGTSLLQWADRSAGAVDTESRARATVRDGEDSLEVLVLFDDVDGVRQTAPWGEAGGTAVPLNEVPDRALQKRIQGSALRLPGALSKPWNIDAHIRELEERFDMPEWHACPPLKGELLLVFDADLTARVGDFQLRYSQDDGLEVNRVES